MQSTNCLTDFTSDKFLQTFRKLANIPENAVFSSYLSKNDQKTEVKTENSKNSDPSLSFDFDENKENDYFPSNLEAQIGPLKMKQENVDCVYSLVLKECHENG